MKFIVSAGTQQQLASKLVDAGILTIKDNGFLANEGMVFSFIGFNSSEYHAFVSIDESIVTNAADIVLRVQADINKPGAPLRAKVGEMPPEVVEALPDWAIRKALEALSLSTAWDTAITSAVNAAGKKDIIIWWDRATQISTLEPEWQAIVARMVWGKESETTLITKAKQLVEVNG